MRKIMKTLAYFIETAPPAWVFSQLAKYGIPRTLSWGSVSDMGMTRGSIEILSGKTCVIVPFPAGQTTIVWGDTIEKPRDKSYLKVDGDIISFAEYIDVIKVTPIIKSPVAPTQVSAAQIVSRIGIHPKKSTTHTATISMIGIIATYHPPEISFNNIKTVGKFINGQYVQEKSGTVTFKNGVQMTIQEYDGMSEDERKEIDSQPSFSASMRK